MPSCNVCGCHTHTHAHPIESKPDKYPHMLAAAARAVAAPQPTTACQQHTLLRAALSRLARMRFTRFGSSSISSLSLLPLQPPRLPPARLPLRLGPKPSLSLSLSQSLQCVGEGDTKSTQFARHSWRDCGGGVQQTSSQHGIRCFAPQPAPGHPPLTIQWAVLHNCRQRREAMLQLLGHCNIQLHGIAAGTSIAAAPVCALAACRLLPPTPLLRSCRCCSRGVAAACCWGMLVL